MALGFSTTLDKKCQAGKQVLQSMKRKEQNLPSNYVPSLCDIHVQHSVKMKIPKIFTY